MGGPLLFPFPSSSFFFFVSFFFADAVASFSLYFFYIVVFNAAIFFLLFGGFAFAEDETMMASRWLFDFYFWVSPFRFLRAAGSAFRFSTVAGQGDDGVAINRKWSAQRFDSFLFCSRCCCCCCCCFLFGILGPFFAASSDIRVRFSALIFKPIDPLSA